MRTIGKPLPVTAHEVDCERPGWSVQQRIIARGPLLATCRGCGAVRRATGTRTGGKGVITADRQ